MRNYRSCIGILLCMALIAGLTGCSGGNAGKGEKDTEQTGRPPETSQAEPLSVPEQSYGTGKFIGLHMEAPDFPEEAALKGQEGMTDIVASYPNEHDPERPLYLFQRNFGERIYFYFYYLNENWEWVRAGTESPVAEAVEGLNRDGLENGSLTFLCREESGSLCFCNQEREEAIRIVTVKADGSLTGTVVDKTRLEGIGSGDSAFLYAVWEGIYYYEYWKKGSAESGGCLAADREGRLIHRYETLPAVFLPGKLVMMEGKGSRSFLRYVDTNGGKELVSEEITELGRGMLETIQTPNQEGTLYLYNTKGVFIKTASGSAWEQILDPAKTPVVSGQYITGSRNQFIAFFSGRDDFDCYVYHFEAGAETKTELTVYSLSDKPFTADGRGNFYSGSDFVELAAQKYMEKHPEVSVKIHYADAERQTVTDAVKTLNTRLLAGEGEDIIILDGLPASGLVEKGALADISALAGEKELVSGALVKPFTLDGKIYAIPARFQTPILLGTGENLEGVEDLHSFVEKCRELKNMVPDADPLYHMEGEMLAGVFYSASAPAWIKDGSFNRELFAAFLTDLSELTGLAPEGRDGDQYPSWPMQTAQSKSVPKVPELFYYVCNAGREIFYDEHVYFNLYYRKPEKAGGKERFYTALPGQAGGVLVPLQICSINRNSKNREQAEDFIRFILSVGMRKKTMDSPLEGLPARKELLVPSMKEFRDMYDFSVRLKDGSIFARKTEKDGETVRVIQKEELSDQQIESLCGWMESLDTVYVRNIELYDIIMPQILKYLDKKQSLETTVELVGRKAELYLKE